MGTVVFILGRSGTGKSYSMRNFDPSELAIINIQSKILPFRNGAKFNIANTDNVEKVIFALNELSKTYKAIVVDDFQYLMANEFMRRSTERGYDKFTEIARHAWDVIDRVRFLPNETIVYIMCHTDTDNEGVERLKTIGKMLDEKIDLEGMATIVLKTNVSDGQYTFLTQNNGKDTVKSPFGMFPSYAIENNLKYVDEKIRNYFGMEDCLNDFEIKSFDEAAAKEVETKPRRKRVAETAVNNPVIVPEVKTDETPTETNEAPTRRVRTAETADVTPEDITTSEAVPQRRRRKAVETQAAPKPTTEAATTTNEPRRRRRKTTEDNGVMDLLNDDKYIQSDLPFDV